MATASKFKKFTAQTDVPIYGHRVILVVSDEILLLGLKDSQEPDRTIIAPEWPYMTEGADLRGTWFERLKKKFAK